MRSAADAAPSFLYLPGLASSGESFTIDGEEARYAARVVRAREGERLTATDGAGLVARLVVERVRPTLEVRVESRERHPEPPRTVLLCGAPEGERGDWLVEKCAELGVTLWAPVDTQRVRWPEGHRGDRWHRLAVAGLRQSRGAWLLRSSEPSGLEESLAALGPGERWLADPSGAALGERGALGDGPVTGLVGPSSGFSDREHKVLLEKGFSLVRLARQRLRTETAALSLAALWAAERSRSAGATP